MRELTVNEIKEILLKKEYPFFDNEKPYNINLIGVRSNNEGTNQFDDLIYLVYRDNTLAWKLNIFKATTDPGKYWLNHPISPIGTAILTEGHHKGIWRMGLHQGKYIALVQNRPVTIYRDSNRDNKIDLCHDTIVKGVYGINLHRSNLYAQSYLVEKWSAGCQVLANPDDYSKLIWVCQRSLNFFPNNSFSYTLLNESDL